MSESEIKNLDLYGLEKLGRKLADLLQPGDVVLLDGDLGAGKTQLAKYIIHVASETDVDVPSPTFTLVQVYDTNIGEIWHFDLYRLDDEHELEAIGLDEAFQDSISLIEWPDRLGRYRPKSRLEVSMTINADETRTVKISPVGPKWTNRNIPE